MPGPSDLLLVPNLSTEEVAKAARKQVWMRECPRCKAPIEKEQPADSWKCPRCGWE